MNRLKCVVGIHEWSWWVVADVRRLSHVDLSEQREQRCERHCFLCGKRQLKEN